MSASSEGESESDGYSTDGYTSGAFASDEDIEAAPFSKGAKSDTNTSTGGVHTEEREIGSKLHSGQATVPSPGYSDITVHRQAILLLVVESESRKLRNVESRTKFPFDVERDLDSTTVLVLDSTPILLLLFSCPMNNECYFGGNQDNMLKMVETSKL